MTTEPTLGGQPDPILAALDRLDAGMARTEDPLGDAVRGYVAAFGQGPPVWEFLGHQEALAYPAAYLFAFLDHHGFLVQRDAPTWHTVVGGSRSYVEAVTARLDVVRVEVDDDQDDVGEVGSGLPVGDHLVVIDREEPQVAVEVERRVLAADGVDPGDEVAEGPRSVEVPVADLVLLRVEIFLGAGLPGLADALFERGSVDPVGRP